MLLLLGLGCFDPPKDASSGNPDDTGPAGDSADTGAPGPSCVEDPLPPSEKDTGDAPRVGRTLSGSVTWSLAFDAEAEAAGFTDCSYTRVYAATEVGDQGYLCPECELLTTADTVMTSGYEDCFLQIDDDEAERTEHVGFGEVDGERHFFRTGNENVRLSDMGAAVGGAESWAVAWESEAELTAGGNMLLTAEGTFTEATSDDVWIEDVTGARTEPYTCGWPQNSPGGPNPTWTVATGEVFPNLRLVDQCGDEVDLWDFRGYYLVIDSSAPNCGPCQAMAEGAEAFKARMAASCAPVEMITLLNESLSAINQPASAEDQQAWVDAFGLSSPVLADKGAAYALFPEYLDIESGMSYPAVILVDPDGRVMYGATGFSDWSEFRDIILEDWAARGG
jgi:peroxiredoxin